MSRVGEVKTSALISYLTVGFNVVAGLLYTPWIIATIGKTDYGLYTLVMSLVSLLVFDFGVSIAVSKFLSEYYARSEKAQAERLLGTAYRLYLWMGVLLALVLTVGYFVLDGLYVRLTAAELSTFKMLYVVAGAYSVLAIPFTPANGVLLASEQLITLRLWTLIQRVATVSLIVVCLLWGQGVLALVAVNAAFGLVIAEIRLFIARRTPGGRADFRRPAEGMMRRLLGLSGWVTATQVAQRLVFNIAPSILGVVSGTIEIGMFGLASTLEGYVYTVSEALNGLFLPRVSRMLTGPDCAAEILDFMIRVGRIQTYIVGAIIIGFLCFGGDFMTAWMGAGFEDVYIGAFLLIIPSLVELPQQVGATAVLAAGHVREQTRVYAMMAAMSVALCFALGGRLGAVGACAAIAIAYAARTVGMNVVYSRTLRLDMRKFFSRTYGSWVAPAGLSLAVGLGLNRLFSAPGWATLAAEVGIFSVVYVFIMCVMALDDSEKALLRGLVPR